MRKVKIIEGRVFELSYPDGFGADLYIGDSFIKMDIAVDLAAYNGRPIKTFQGEFAGNGWIFRETVGGRDWITLTLDLKFGHYHGPYDNGTEIEIDWAQDIHWVRLARNFRKPSTASTMKRTLVG